MHRGGYLEDFNKDNHLEILHKKELILNTKETEDLLRSLNFFKESMKVNGEMLRNISKNLRN